MTRTDAPLAPALPTREESQARFAEFGQRVVSRLPAASLSAWWADRVASTPDNIVVKTDVRALSYAELDAVADRVALATHRQGVESGDVIALQLSSSAAFLALILGASKLGVRISLLGPNLRGRSLLHALAEIPPCLVFTTPTGRSAIDALDEFEVPPLIELTIDTTDLAAPSDSGLGALEAWTATVLGTGGDSGPIGAEAPRAGLTQSPDETLFYIFTSGTTGLPKATQCSHRRYLAGGASEGILFAISETDCMYVSLPMFHIAALSSIGAALSVGASVAIRPRFSASRFWDDVRRFEATQFQYLGEIVRYLLAQPARAEDRPNSLKAILGAGLSRANWRAFEERFGPLRIVESYGSSEGVIGIFNLDGVAGSVGRAPATVEERLRIVRYDRSKDELERASDGRLILSLEGEPGELIARLEDRSQFEGYSSEEATRSKLLENAFEDGDLWYRSGDLFRKEEDYYYFVSRLGDTYRWKGENVSTTEVANAIATCHFVAHAPRPTPFRFSCASATVRAR